MNVVLVCDFYVTKSNAKARPVLSSALPWLMQGIRRLEQANQASEEPVRWPERSLSRLRCMMFAANRWHRFLAT